MTLFRRIPASLQLVTLSLLSLAALGLASRSATAGETLAKIKQSGKVTVGTEAAFPPFEFIREGKIVGYDKDILDSAVAGLGVQLEQIDVPWQGLFPGLLAGKFDFIASAMTMYDEPTRKFAFTMPVAEATVSLLRRKGDERIKSREDLDGKTVATQLGTGAEKLLRELDAKLKAGGKQGFEIKSFTSAPEAFLALANNQADAAASLLPTMLTLMQRRPGIYELVGPLVAQRQYIGWVARPDDVELRDYLSAKIKELRDSGQLYQWQEKWFGFRMELPDSGYKAAGAI
jgi:polar amino acid transport system substrate-binding protein